METKQNMYMGIKKEAKEILKHIDNFLNSIKH